jgi:Ser/Thr protein kinase RdoA (MazF antagonist)
MTDNAGPDRDDAPAQVLADWPVRPLSITSISVVPAQIKLQRQAFRVDLADGSTIKLRALENADAAAQLVEVRSGTDPDFAPVLARMGPWLVEQWVIGETLTSEAAAGRAGEIGQLLARLHQLPLEEQWPGRQSTAFFRRRAEDDLAAVRNAAVIGPREAAALQAMLVNDDPGEAVVTRVHQDICPENLVANERGDIVVIDNEWMRVGSPVFDLWRTLCRWEMSETTRAAFLGGYGAPEARGADGEVRFWAAAAVLFSAKFQHQMARGELRGTRRIIELLLEG